MIYPVFYLSAFETNWNFNDLLLILQAFAGTQNVSSLQKDEAWRVNVRIQGCDLDHGYLCGTMEALNVPLADTPVSYPLSFLVQPCFVAYTNFKLSIIHSCLSPRFYMAQAYCSCRTNCYWKSIGYHYSDFCFLSLFRWLHFGREK